ncbi:hypothetical protein PHACT_06125 [Pseudohongiella acticola]|uniref:ASPIC/UnbV domain-containing protein n=1 Tax=Pseudohongiella acticola TaxID=1524254 RepID=A0A1E8CJX0_9GAMM|nr:VCBS repeat-containing protein [Pseudohongiella acticola]OFE12766.1 hypothetical protein PHACT_06125 [Pseudohongiella acticola]
MKPAKAVTPFRHTVLWSMLFAAPLSMLADAQTSQRSTYSAGETVFSHFIMNTEMTDDRLVYFEDVNGDGFTDIVVTGYTPVSRPAQGEQPGQILLNNGDNTFRAATGDKPQTEWAREVLVADFNNDTIPDIFIADHGWDAAPFPGFRNQLMLGTGQGFINATDRLPNLSDFSHNAAVGDINGDGFIDILVTNSPQGDAAKSPYFLINKGSAQFELDRSHLPANITRGDNSEFAWAVELADLDGDGHTDMIFGRKQGVNTLPTRIYWNPGNGNFTNAAVTNLPEMQRFVSGDQYEIIEIKAYDVNGNGRRDLIMSAYNASFRGTAMQLLSNNGNRQFSDSTDVCLSGVDQDPDNARNTPYFLRQADINFDGVPDMLAMSNNDTSAQTTMFFERGNTRLRAISRESLGVNAETAQRLQYAQAIVGNGVFGYAEVFTLLDNGQRKLGLNYVPVTSSSVPPVASRFDVCSNLMTSAVDAADFGRIQLSFRLLSMEPSVRIQVLPESIKDLTSLPGAHASFDPVSGLLRVPELVLDDAVAYRGMVFQLIDGDQLIFELVATD